MEIKISVVNPETGVKITLLWTYFIPDNNQAVTDWFEAFPDGEHTLTSEQVKQLGELVREAYFSRDIKYTEARSDGVGRNWEGVMLAQFHTAYLQLQLTIKRGQSQWNN